MDDGSAIELINNSTIREEKMGKPYFDRGTIYLDILKDLDKALDNFNMAISYDSTNADYFRNRGKVYLQKGDSEKKDEDFLKAIELNPDLENVLRPYLGRRF